MGSNPAIPGDLIGEPGPPLKGTQLRQLLEALRTNAAKPPIQTTHNRTPTINYPDLTGVTHVFVKKGKTSTLGPSFEGPFEIVERLGASCIRVRVGSYANGQPRIETQHWSNCKPAVLSDGVLLAEKAAKGRKKQNP